MEWQSKLAESVNSKALFALYLAMHSQPGLSNVTFQSDSNVVPQFDVTSLNHYRRAPQACSEKSVDRLNVTSNLMHENDISGVLLWQSMHPDPLSIVDNAKKLPPDVKSNCSYITQQLLAQKIHNAIEVDETRLDDIVKGSTELLN
nr:VC2046/SO_2500 family protein [Alteromonas sp. ASW11-130]